MMDLISKSESQFWIIFSLLANLFLRQLLLILMLFNKLIAYIVYFHRKCKFASSVELCLNRDISAKILTDKLAYCKAYTNSFRIEAVLISWTFVGLKDMLLLCICHT